jgi:hypothetical protein
MSSYRQILYQIVFRTKHSHRTLKKENREVLFSYIHGMFKNKKGTRCNRAPAGTDRKPEDKSQVVEPSELKIRISEIKTL